MIKRLALGFILLAATLTRVHGGETEPGRYLLLPIKDGEVLILLDTATGQNWSAKPTETWSHWPKEEERQRTVLFKEGTLPRSPISWYPNAFVSREYALEIKDEEQTYLVPAWAGQYLPPSASELGKPGSDSDQVSVGFADQFGPGPFETTW